jgi:hypothetical protein
VAAMTRPQSRLACVILVCARRFPGRIRIVRLAAALQAADTDRLASKSAHTAGLTRGDNTKLPTRASARASTLMDPSSEV